MLHSMQTRVADLIGRCADEVVLGKYAALCLLPALLCSPLPPLPSLSLHLLHLTPSLSLTSLFFVPSREYTSDQR